VKSLRKKYPKFVYSDYSWEIKKKDLVISFNFIIEPDISFKPEVIIRNVDRKIEKNTLDNLVFHLGLIEMLSYWKATCSPLIEVRAGELNNGQIKWWKDLIFNGMGQFFYENNIDWRGRGFLKIKSKGKKSKVFSGSLKKNILVPVGGGKDSLVTIELLKKKKINCFSLNPISPVKNVMKIAGCKNPIIVERKIDKKLLQLNKKGFLNGHTPFSAYLAFLSVLLAVVSDYKYLAFSNERSSNEGNVKYLGKVINHQYSKSFAFEKKFRAYSKEFLASNVEYFSFLRPLYEIQIAKIFSCYPKYFSSFLSCNKAFKINSPNKKWCCKCPKCLFIYAVLYPFLDKKDILKIFGKDLFKDKGLIPLMEQLTTGNFKPFECVGTKKESLVAFYLSSQKDKDSAVLKYFGKKILPKYPNLSREADRIMASWNDDYFLPKDFVLKK